MKLRKLLAPICVLLVAVITTTVFTLALLSNTTPGITNKFKDGSVGCEVVEDITTTPGVKANVKLKNTGTNDAFMRACVVVNWVDAKGNVYKETPKAGVDYTVTTPTTFGFITDGNMYYCKTAVKPGETTPILFTAIKPVEGKAPDGYVLSVDILSSSMQSAPASAVQNAWGVTVSGNAITKGASN